MWLEFRRCLFRSLVVINEFAVKTALHIGIFSRAFSVKHATLLDDYKAARRRFPSVWFNAETTEAAATPSAGITKSARKMSEKSGLARSMSRAEPRTSNGVHFMKDGKASERVLMGSRETDRKRQCRDARLPIR